MPSLADLMQKFAGAGTAAADPAPAPVPARQPAATGGDHIKLATGGEPAMQSLFDIYNALAGQDMAKTAQAAYAPQNQNGASEEDIEADFAKMAAQIAEDEAGAQVDGGGDEDEMMKIAAEYDSAGRIMARGFYDEFTKLAEGVISAPDNQNTESPSAAKTPALGERGLPTLETNYAGTTDHDVPMATTGADNGKQNYADALATSKTISAGQGTGTDPEAAAIALGGGSPVGFATIRDLAL